MIYSLKNISKKILEVFNLKINLIYKKNSLRDFRQTFFPRPSITFIDRINFQKKELIGVEIGVFVGVNSEYILKSLPIKKLYLIDPYYYEEDDSTVLKGDEEKIAKKRLRGYKEKIIFIKKNSKDAVADLPNDLDFIYIDGNHLYKYVRKDIGDYYKKLKSGGVLAGHDVENCFTEKHQGHILKALLDFAKEKKLEPYYNEEEKESFYKIQNINNLKGKFFIGCPDWWIVKK